MSALPSVKLIDGKATAARVLAEVREQVLELRQGGVQPGLAVVLVGADAASHVYVRNKVLRAEEVGIRSLEHRLHADTTQAHLLTLIDRLNRDPEVNGILVQLPLPGHIDEHRVLQAISRSRTWTASTARTLVAWPKAAMCSPRAPPALACACCATPVASCAASMRWWSAARTLSANPWLPCCCRPTVR